MLWTAVATNSPELGDLHRSARVRWCSRRWHGHGPTTGIADIGAFESGTWFTKDADFDGNGRTDFATYDPLTRTIIAYLGATQGIDQFALGPLDPKRRWESFRIGDFNGDGRDDIFFKEQGTTSWSIAVSEGAKFNAVYGGTTASTPGWTTIYTGDFDGDGAQELLGWNILAARWEMLQYDDRLGMSLQTTWGNALAPSGTLQPLHIGDVDQDGRDDIVAYDTANGGAWKAALSQKQTDGTDRFVTIAGPAGDWNSWFSAWDSEPPNAPYQNLNIEQPYQVVLEKFSEIYNEYELELYPGLMKGIQATAETKAGNDWDLAALLVDRLDAAGFQSQIVFGKVDVPTKEVAQWLGIRTDGMTVAAMQAAALKVLGNVVDAGAVPVNGEVSIRFKHALVRVTVPTATGLTAVHLDPSWKFKNRNATNPADLTTAPTPYTAVAGRSGRGTFDEFGYLANSASMRCRSNGMKIRS